jgi:hypothetical protein
MSAATRTSPASSSRSSTDSSNPRANESHSRDPATSAPTLNSRTGTSVFAERRGRAQINAARLVAQDVNAERQSCGGRSRLFDFARNQTGEAKNYIELCPLLSLRRI